MDIEGGSRAEVTLNEHDGKPEVSITRPFSIGPKGWDSLHKEVKKMMGAVEDENRAE